MQPFNPIAEHQRLRQIDRERRKQAIDDAIRFAKTGFIREPVKRANFDDLAELEECAHDTYEQLYGGRAPASN
ncbi:MAG TPA: hypothetical protein PKJ68_04460 [Candidatus Woesebacteria bacterium]|nr:hypothetical protein [Candidatus Woesebacteria bacterium]